MNESWLATRDVGIAHIAQTDRVLAQSIKDYGPVTFHPHDNHYAALVDAIVGQQLSDKAAATILGRLKALYNDKLPSPSQIMTTDEQALRDVGMSWSKVSFLKDLAEHVDDGRLDLKHISRLSDAEVTSQLTVIKGIGEWTTHMFLIFCLGRLDVLPTGDLGIQKGMKKLAGLDHLPRPAEMHALARERGWHPYASIACWYLWRWLDGGAVRATAR